MAVRRYDGPPGAAVGSPAEPAGAWLFDCPALPPKAPGYAASEARRWVFMGALSVLRSGRFAFCHGTVGFLDTALCTFWSRSGSFHGAAVERSGTAGGMKRVLPAKVEEGLQCAVRWVLGSGVGGGMVQCGHASVGLRAWPGCANGAKRSAAPM